MKPPRRDPLRSVLIHAGVVLTSISVLSSAMAGPREQAARIHERLTGLTPSPAVLDSMSSRLADGDALGAALEAMEHPEFLNTTVRAFATPWTSPTFSAYGDLNDSTATVIGMVRDDVPFDRVLYEDIVYVGSAAATTVPYSRSDNRHYLELQNSGLDLGDPGILVRRQQSAQPGSADGPTDAAGVLTTRGFAQALRVAETKPASISMAMMSFVCMDMSAFRDVTTRPNRISQVVSRSPGGDASPTAEVRRFAMELARSPEFAACQVERVFRQVCYREPDSDADRRALNTITDIFENNNRSMKRVYAETAAYCRGV